MTHCPFCGQAVASHLDDLTDHFVECPCAPVARGGGLEREIAGILAANMFSFAAANQTHEASEVR